MCLGIPGVAGAEAEKFRATKNQRNMFFILKCRYYVFIAFQTLGVGSRFSRIFPGHAHESIILVYDIKGT